MNLKLLTSTAHIETVIATAMLTTTSGAKPSILFNKLKADPERVIDLMERLEAQHGSILEHNRICWRMEASDSEVLEILLSNRFFMITRLESYSWLLSANLRMISDYTIRSKSPLSDALMASLRTFAPNIYECIKRRLI